MKRRPVAVLIAATLCFGAFAAPARAEEATEAARYFQNGLGYAQAGELDLAAFEFRRAYEASPNYSVLYNLGQTYALMGKPAEAVDAYQRYLDEGGTHIDQRRRRAVESSISFQLKRLGELDLDVEPEGVRVELDGEPLELPGKPLRLVVGRHGLVFTAPGYASRGESVLVEAGRSSKLTVRLEPLAAPEAPRAVLQVDCDVPDVTLNVDGSEIGVVEQRSLLALEAGSRRIEFRRSGYVAPEQMVELRADRATAVSCRLRPRMPLPSDLGGELRVLVNEPGSRVTLDGVAFSGGFVPVGRHRLEVRHFGFKPWARDVTVTRAKLVELPITLEPEPEYVEESRQAAQKKRTWSYVLGGGGLAFGGAALTLWIVSQNEHDEWLEQKRALEAAAPGADTSSERQAFQDQTLKVQRLGDWALGSAVAGGALLAAGTALFVSAAETERYGSLGARVTHRSSELRWTKAW